MLDLSASGLAHEQRGASLLDGPHWYASYRCADGRDITVGALEPKFYQLLLEKLDLAGDARFAQQHKPGQWQAQKHQLAELFATRPRDEWCALLEGSDVCFAPVLTPSEAAAHPHLAARGVYSREDGLLQAQPAPRFSHSPPAASRPIPQLGEHTDLLLGELHKSTK